MLAKNLRNERWSAQEKAHFAFLHSMRRCCLSGATVGLEVAHIRHLTGAALKPHWTHTLPMIHSLHISQEAGGADWWGWLGFPLGSENDPRLWAERLAEVTGNPEQADDLLRDMRARANRSAIYDILKRERYP